MTQQPPNLYDAEPIPPTARAEIAQLLQSGDLFRYTASGSSPVSLLERDFAALLGSRYALAVSSCSAALFLSLKALDLPRDARVLVPGFTFAAVPSAVVHADCVPVLCEVGENYRIDIEDFSKQLEQNVSAVIVSHMRGHTSDMDEIMARCDARGIAVVEDAAHSLGATWSGRNIGTIGHVGCFSFQSYKLVNAGEGGVLVTDDVDLIARAVIMSGAYEHHWQQHNELEDEALASAFERWQNHLPLYNLRLSNLSAAVIRAQTSEIPRRVRDGRANYNYVAQQLSQSPWFDVPEPLEAEHRAPDSIQFNLTSMDEGQMVRFVDCARQKGVKVTIFGRSEDNARVFWNWHFLPERRDLPRTRAMLMSACDVRLPVWLKQPDLDVVTGILLEAVNEVMRPAKV